MNTKKNRLKYLAITILSLASLSLALTTYNVIQYFNIESLFSKPEKYSMALMIIVLSLFFIHILMFILFALFVRRHSKIGILSSITVIIGIISIISFFSTWGGLTDIFKEFPLGLEINNELQMVRSSTTIQIVFLLLLTFISSAYTDSSEIEPKNKIDSEKLFTILNSSGIICGLIGISLSLTQLFLYNRITYKWAIIPELIIVLLPYLIILVSWLTTKLKNNSGDVFDEKQFNDLKKAGLFTWIFSVIFLLILYISNFSNLNGWLSLYWLPLYIFSSLVLFSLLSIFYNKT